VMFVGNLCPIFHLYLLFPQSLNILNIEFFFHTSIGNNFFTYFEPKLESIE
jgi:hypothetical protein